MGWIKRNLFFVIGVAIAVALMGAAGFYIFESMGRNSKAYEDLTNIYSQLKQFANSKAGDAKINNTQTAKDETEQLRQWIGRARGYFQPIASIPSPTNGPLTDATFAYALHRTISQLQQEANAANVTVPPQYNFSFQAQSDKVRFAPPGSVDKLAVQLGEVKDISEIIFSAHVNALEGIQRLRVSDDDTQGQATDYLDSSAPSPDGTVSGQVITTDLATLTPYQVTFDGFTTEIAEVLTALASSPHGFIVKTINVQPANNNTSTTATPPLPGRGGLQTILTEQMLRVTVMVEVIRLSPGK